MILSDRQTSDLDALQCSLLAGSSKNRHNVQINLGSGDVDNASGKNKIQLFVNKSWLFKVDGEVSKPDEFFRKGAKISSDYRLLSRFPNIERVSHSDGRISGLVEVDAKIKRRPFIQLKN